MMKRIIFAGLFILSVGISHAQKGRNQVDIAAEAAIPFFQNEAGGGIFVKGLYGFGHSAQFSLMTGFSSFKLKNSVDHGNTTTRLIPVLLGYKQNLHRFYIEPQVGFGEMGGKIDINGDYARPSAGAFFWALGAGYDHGKIMAGLRFQQAHGAGSAAAGLWYNRSFHHTSVHFGYRLFRC